MLLHLTARAHAPPHSSAVNVAPSVAEANLTDTAMSIYMALLDAERAGVFNGGGSVEFIVQAAHTKPTEPGRF